MTDKTNTLSSFMRGGQYLAHIANMIWQNITRGLAVCAVIAFVIASYFYIKKLDGYDKYVMAIEFTAMTKRMTPIAKEQYNNHFIDLYSPVSPNQEYIKVLIKERRMVPWYEYERAKTFRKLKAGMWLTLFDSILILIFLSVISSSLGRVITKDKQTRGARLSTKRELIREVRAFNKSEAKKTKMLDYKPYEIEQVEYPLRAETQHTLIAGTTGAGKTQLQIRLLQQVTLRNDRAVIYDKMRSYVPMFFNPVTDHIMNVLDARCPAWDIFADARNMVEWTSIAQALIQSKDEDDYWTQGARAIFSNTANRLQQQCRNDGTHPRLTDLLYLLTQSTVDDLYVFLEGTEAARHINPAADKQSASMLSTLSQSITCLGFVKDSTPENPGFSFRRWMADDTLKGKLFLTSRDDQHATLQPLLTTWMSICTTALMSQKRSNNRLCWFFIDELPSLNRLPDLENGLAQARQYGGAFVLGIQLESQLQETYGDNGAQTIMGLTLNKAIFNPGDPSTAKVMADAIGKTEIIRRNEGISLGANRIRDGVSMNSQITQEHIVLPEELMCLPNLTFYLKLKGALPCAQIEMKYIPIEEHHEGYIQDQHFMSRYEHKLSSANSADAARAIIRQIRKSKSDENFGQASNNTQHFEKQAPLPAEEIEDRPPSTGRETIKLYQGNEVHDAITGEVMTIIPTQQEMELESPIENEPQFSEDFLNRLANEPMDWPLNPTGDIELPEVGPSNEHMKAPDEEPKTEPEDEDDFVPPNLDPINLSSWLEDDPVDSSDSTEKTQMGPQRETQPHTPPAELVQEQSLQSEVNKPLEPTQNVTPKISPSHKNQVAMDSSDGPPGIFGRGPRDRGDR